MQPAVRTQVTCAYPVRSRERYYESGLFSVKLSKSQFFDNVTSRTGSMVFRMMPPGERRIVNRTSVHGITGGGQIFPIPYSGDSSYPFALFMYENDGTPVVATGSGNLSQSSYIGQSENV